MASKVISEFYENDKKAIVLIDLKDEVYNIEFYEKDHFVESKAYKEKDLQWVETVAENWCNGDLNYENI